MKIVVGASSFAAQSNKAIDLLLNKGVEVVKNPYGRKLTPEETIAHLKGADGILAGLETLDEAVLSKADSLKAITRIGIGMENVDLDYAKSRGIKISNTPSGPTEAVAEMTVAALLSIGRQIIPSNDDMHKGIWKKRIGFSLNGLRVLIIGYGRIGQRVGEMLKAFNADVIVYDPAKEGHTIDLLKSMLSEADAITLHASGKDEILTAELIEAMKTGVVLLNSARGGLVCEDALYKALKTGEISHYWGDVFPQEPYNGKLLECENAILTPHIATYSRQCRESMETEAVLNIMKDLGI